MPLTGTCSGSLLGLRRRAVPPQPALQGLRREGGGVKQQVPTLALSPDAAAAALGVSRTFLDEQIAHELRWVRRGRRKLVSVRELERWLESNAALTIE